MLSGRKLHGGEVTLDARDPAVLADGGGVDAVPDLNSCRLSHRLVGVHVLGHALLKVLDRLVSQLLQGAARRKHFLYPVGSRLLDQE